MKNLFAISFLFILQQIVFGQPAERFSFPAEFEKQDAVWMTWADGNFFAGDSVGDVIIEIVKQLVPDVQVNLLVNDASTKADVTNRFLKNNIVLAG